MKNTTIKTLIVTLLINGQLELFAQQKMPVNSNILIENAISPKVLDAALSSTLQQGSFKQDVHVHKEIGNETVHSAFQFIYDPTYKDGIDIRIAYEQDSLGYLKEKELLKLMQEMHSFSRLSKSYLYDESSLKLISYSKDEIILSYKYNPLMLEPELKYGKKVNGKIYIRNKELWKVELINSKRIKYLHHRIAAGDFKYTTFFKRAKNGGGHIVESTIQEYSYKKRKNTVVKVKTVSTTSEYKDSNGILTAWDEMPTSKKASKNLKNIDGTLGWALPIFGKNARKLGYHLPRAVGVSLFTHLQSQELDFTDIKVGANDGELITLNNLFNLDISGVPQTTQVQMIRADAWIFPFLNISGLIGQGKNNIDGSLYLDEEVREAIGKLGWLIGFDPEDVPEYIPLKAELTSLTYGAGVTLAGGIDNFNLSINYQLVLSQVIEANTTKVAQVINPSLGYMTPLGVNIMVGAQGQFYNPVTQGFLELPGGNKLDYAVNFKPIRWNYIFGLYIPVSDHFDFAIQSGWGQRRSLTAVLGYRL